MIGRLLKTGDRGLSLTNVIAQYSQIEVGFGVGGIEGQNSVQVFERGSIVVQPMQRVGPVAVSFNGRIVVANRLGKVRNRFIVALKL